jgi:hypothetical protein
VIELARGEQLMAELGELNTLWTTLTIPLLVPTTRPGTDDDDVTKVFNAVTPSFVPAADVVVVVQRLRDVEPVVA